MMIRQSMVWVSVCAVAAMVPSLSADDSMAELLLKRAADAQEQEVEILRKLERPIDVTFVETSIEDFAGWLGETLELSVAINDYTLSELGVSREDTFSLTMRDAPAYRVLDEVCKTEVRDLAYRIDGGLLTITTAFEAAESVTSLVYNVQALLPKLEKPLPRKARGVVRTDSGVLCGDGSHQGGQGGGYFCVDEQDDDDANTDESGAQSEGTARSAVMTAMSDPRPTDFYDFDSLIDVIAGAAGGDSWEELGGFGTINPLVVGGKPVLVVSQSIETHQEIASLLVQLRQVANEPSVTAK